MATARPDFYKGLEDIIACGVCLERCTEPRSLPCLHNFCLKCLEQLVHTSGQAGNIICPNCRVKITLPQGGPKKLPGNFHWNTLGETLDNLKRLNLHAKPKCTPCVKRGVPKSADFFCIDCTKNFCSDCLVTHNQIVSGHDMLDCESITAEDINMILKSKHDRCSRHTEKNTEFYCKTCQTMMCITCAVVEHATHNKQELDTVAEHHRDDLRKLNEEFSQRVLHYEKCLHTITEAKQETIADELKNVNIVQQHGRQLLQHVQRVIQQVTDEIKSEAAKSVQQLDSLYTTVSQELTCLKKSVSQMETSIKHANASTIVNISVNDTPTFHQLLKRFLPTHELNKPMVSFHLVNLRQLTTSVLIGQKQITKQTKPLREEKKFDQQSTKRSQQRYTYNTMSKMLGHHQKHHYYDD